MVIGGGERKTKKKISGIIICMFLMMASFTIATTTLADWEPGDGHKMHHPQTPDLTDTGIDISFTSGPLGDDFKCSDTGLVTDIHFWGSFRDDVMPVSGPDNLALEISIHDDIPVSPTNPWSKPGGALWTKSFGPGQYSVREITTTVMEGFYDPVTNTYIPDNHKRVFQYNFEIDANQAFIQEETLIYWLVIEDITTFGGYTFGWKTADASLQYNDMAVYTGTSGWAPLEYPDGHIYEGDAADLAFVITGGEDPPPPPPTITITPYPFNPVTLNLASNGRWVKAVIQAPAGYEPEDFVESRIMLEDAIPVNWSKVTGKKLMLKFDRSELEDHILMGPPPVKPAEFKIAGILSDGTQFVGYSEPVTLI
jgi:hypothetical protein